VAFVLVAAEVILSARAVPAAVRYSVYPPNQSVSVKVDPNVTPGVEGDALFEINAIGTRGPLLRSDDQVRILAIGGSTTECFVLSLEESWPWLLGRTLGERTGKRVWVGNIGRAGRTSRQHYFDAKYVAPQFGTVDVAVLLVGINDLFNRMIQGEAFDAGDVVKLDAGGEYLETALQVSDIEDGWFARLQLVRRGRRALEAMKLLSPKEREVRRLLSQTLPDYYLWSREQRALRGSTLDGIPPMEEAIAEYGRNLSLIVDLLRARGTVPVLVTQPALWRDNLSERETGLLWIGSADGWPPNRTGGPYYSVRAMAAMLAMYNDALRRIGAEKKVEVVDLAAGVPADLDTFYDDVHFNESGARRVAAAIGEALLARRVVSPDRESRAR